MIINFDVSICRGIVRSDSVWDKLVFRKVREGMGGRLRIMVVGSAPLAGNVLTFARCALGCLVCIYIVLLCFIIILILFFFFEIGVGMSSWAVMMMIMLIFKNKSTNSGNSVHNRLHTLQKLIISTKVSDF